MRTAPWLRARQTSFGELFAADGGSWLARLLQDPSRDVKEEDDSSSVCEQSRRRYDRWAAACNSNTNRGFRRA